MSPGHECHAWGGFDTPGHLDRPPAARPARCHGWAMKPVGRGGDPPDDPGYRPPESELTTDRRLPVRHRGVEDVAEVVGPHLARADDQQALLLERTLDQRGHVVLGVAEGGDALWRADVARQAAQHVGKRVGPRGLRRVRVWAPRP